MAQYPVIFDTVHVNVGNVWNASLNTAIIIIAGTYYLHVDSTTCTIGGNIMEVRVNGAVAFRVKAPYSAFIGAAQCRGNAAVIKLNAGDKILVNMPVTPSVCVFSGFYSQTSFHGLLITPY